MTKKTLPLISAEAARAYTASTDPTGLYGKIDYAVKNAASKGKTTVDISTIVPQPHSGAWMTDKVVGNAFLAGLIETIEAAGYRVATFAGDYHKRGFINLSWGEVD